MDFLKSLLWIILFCVLIFWLRTRPFREKKTSDPQKTQRSKLIARRIESGTRQSGRSTGMGYSYVLTFRLDTGTELELYAYEVEYGALLEGMEGSLSWKGPYFLSFQED